VRTNILLSGVIPAPNIPEPISVSHLIISVIFDVSNLNTQVLASSTPALNPWLYTDEDPIPIVDVAPES
jgi:hypothetical protein